MQLETLAALRLKWTGMVKIKHIRLALSKLIVEMGLRIYGEGRTQIHLSSPTTIGSLSGIQYRPGLY